MRVPLSLTNSIYVTHELSTELLHDVWASETHFRKVAANRTFRIDNVELSESLSCNIRQFVIRPHRYLSRFYSAVHVLGGGIDVMSAVCDGRKNDPETFMNERFYCANYFLLYVSFDEVKIIDDEGPSTG